MAHTYALFISSARHKPSPPQDITHLCFQPKRDVGIGAGHFISGSQVDDGSVVDPFQIRLGYGALGTVIQVLERVLGPVTCCRVLCICNEILRA